jgi:hypothetical protein
VVFVTRLKDKAAYHVVETRQPPAHSHVRRDELIHLASDRAAQACPYVLRRVEVWDPTTEQVLVFLTNDAGWGPRQRPPSTRTAGRWSCSSRRRNRT